MRPGQALEFEYLADRPQDVPLVIEWWHTVWADRMGVDISHAEEQLHTSLSKTDLPIHILATEAGMPVGTAALKQQELGEVFPDFQYWLGSVFVTEEARDGQIASQLSQHIVEIAKLMHLPQLHLQTINLDGGLYTKLGWRPITEFTYKGEHALLMVKEL